MKFGNTKGNARVPVAVDLFAGAGGLAEGLLRAGIHVAASVELHPQPALTHAFNHSGTGVLVGDIRDLDLDVLDRTLIERAGTSAVDIVVGGPPCQGFSSAGKKSAEDPRNSMFRHFLRVIEHTKPRMFLMENVPGFKNMYSGRVFAESREAFAELGYETVDSVVLAAQYGVPQRRRRFVMVGWMPGEADPFRWPKPTHAGIGRAELFEAHLERTPTVGDALMDLAFLQPGFEATRYADPPAGEFSSDRRTGNHLVFNHLASRHREKAVRMFERIRVGGSIREVEPDLRSQKRTMVRLDPEQVSNTVLSLPDDMLHFRHHRILTVRECARLQTFDDDFVFVGKRTSGFVERRVDVPQYTQVGNAVPPLLGEALGRALLESLGGVSSDLREVDVRRARHDVMCGSSGYAGYTLAPAAKDQIDLRTVHGEHVDLPLTDCDLPVRLQDPLRDWTKAPNPRRGQWAPGVAAKEHPAWMSDAGEAGVAS